MNIKYLFLVSVSGALIALDQVTKMYVHTHFRLGESYVVLKNFFSFTYVRNPGAAFGIMATAPKVFRESFFFAVTPIALLVVLYMIKNTPGKEKSQILALSMVFGGAIGNYIDRIRVKYVIDFLDFHWYRAYTWPAFNVADSAIVVGISILVLATIKAQVDEWKAAKDQTQTT